MDNGLWIYNAACDSHNASDDGRLWLVVNEESSEKKNSYYGYRTRRSVRSQDTWDFAHYYFGKLWLVCGLVSIPISLVPICLVLGKSEQVISVAGLIVLGIQTLLLLVTILLTERALKKNFDEFGRPL